MRFLSDRQVSVIGENEKDLLLSLYKETFFEIDIRIRLAPAILTCWTQHSPCTVLLEKLTGSQPVKKFPAFYGTQKYITSFKTAR